MSILLRYAWCIFILSAVISAFRLKKRVQPAINANHSMKTGYMKIITARFILVTLPWLVVGVGCLSGHVQGLLDFFYPRRLNPFVIALYLVMLAELAFLFYWIFFNNGARYLKRYPGSFSYHNQGLIAINQSSDEIKKKFFTGLIITIALMLLMWVLPIPVIHFN